MSAAEKIWAASVFALVIFVFGVYVGIGWEQWVGQDSGQGHTTRLEAIEIVRGMLAELDSEKPVDLTKATQTDPQLPTMRAGSAQDNDKVVEFSNEPSVFAGKPSVCLLDGWKTMYEVEDPNDADESVMFTSSDGTDWLCRWEIVP